MDLVKITEMIGKLGVDAKESFIYFLWINFSLEIIQCFLVGLFIVLLYKTILKIVINTYSSNRYFVAIKNISEILEQKSGYNDRTYYVSNTTIEKIIKKIKKGNKCP